jgi:hypothetical protein
MNYDGQKEQDPNRVKAEPGTASGAPLSLRRFFRKEGTTETTGRVSHITLGLDIITLYLAYCVA